MAKRGRAFLPPTSAEVLLALAASPALTAGELSTLLGDPSSYRGCRTEKIPTTARLIRLSRLGLVAGGHPCGPREGAWTITPRGLELLTLVFGRA